MSKRERTLALAVVALVAVFAVDQLVVRPLTSRYDQLRSQAQALEEELRGARVLVDNREAIEARWAQMAEAGLTRPASAQRIDVQQRLTRWAEDAGLHLATVSTGQTTAGEPFHETRFVATGSGSLRAVATFMARLEQSHYPLRILESDVTSRDDRGGELSLRLTLSTIRRDGSGDRATATAVRMAEVPR